MDKSDTDLGTGKRLNQQNVAQTIILQYSCLQTFCMKNVIDIQITRIELELSPHVRGMLTCLDLTSVIQETCSCVIQIVRMQYFFITDISFSKQIDVGLHEIAEGVNIVIFKSAFAK